ncbi:MAG: peroxidase family protein [Kiritimatiellia bacterium]
MGLIYVNPEGPNGNPDPVAAAKDIRETFARMAMNDEETVALIAAPPHLRQDPRRRPGVACRARIEAAGLEMQGLGWANSFGTGKGADTITSGLEVTWTTTPTRWSSNFFWNLFGFEWELTRSPAGAQQWIPKNGAGAGTVPHAHDKSKRLAPTMLTTDLSLRFDPAYEKISRRFMENPDQFADAFARAWFKLTHRDMGPRRHLGPRFRRGTHLRTDLAVNLHPLVNDADIAALKAKIRRLSVSELVSIWAEACPHPAIGQARRRERRLRAPGPAEGLGGQSAAQLAKVLKTLEGIQAASNAAQTGGKVSKADLIVLAGGVASRRPRRTPVTRSPFLSPRAAWTPRRSRPMSPSRCSSQRPTASATTSRGSGLRPGRDLLVDKAQLLTLTAPR